MSNIKNEVDHIIQHQDPEADSLLGDRGMSELDAALFLDAVDRMYASPKHIPDEVYYDCNVYDAYQRRVTTTWGNHQRYINI